MSVELSLEVCLEDIAKNGGSDVLLEGDAGDAMEDPGKRELLNNLNTVSDCWYEVPIEKVNFLIPSGKPPSNISPEQWSEIRERATAFGRVVEKELPVIWLLLEMRKLKIDEQFTHKKILEFQREADEKIGKTEAELWFDAVMKYNGYVKILKELHKFAKDADGQPLEFCYHFYRQKEDLAKDVKDVEETFAKFDPFAEEDDTSSEEGDEEEDAEEDAEEEDDEVDFGDEDEEEEGEDEIDLGDDEEDEGEKKEGEEEEEIDDDEMVCGGKAACFPEEEDEEGKEEEKDDEEEGKEEEKDDEEEGKEEEKDDEEEGKEEEKDDEEEGKEEEKDDEEGKEEEEEKEEEEDDYLSASDDDAPITSEDVYSPEDIDDEDEAKDEDEDEAIKEK